MKKKLFYRHPTLPMVIEKFEFDTSALNLEAARRELEEKIDLLSDGDSQTWGYFPELNPNDAEYPQTIQLITGFQETVIDQDPLLRTLPLKLAFVRRAIAEPKSKFGGFHVDANAGISHVWPKDVPADNHVFRMLFNLGDVPRKLEYYPFTLNQLREKGIDIPRDHYEMLKLPDDLPVHSTDIPPAEPGALYGLTFISTKVPHAGRTTGSGHFLISYGGYIDAAMLQRAFPE